MAIQIGRKKQVPIYSETTTTVKDLSTSTIKNYFTVTQGSSYGWDITGSSGLILKPSNIGINSSTATVTLTAVRDLSGLLILGNYYTEQNWDKITLTVAGEIILNAVSGVKGNSNPTTGSNILTRFVDNKELKKGDTIVLTYKKDSSNHHTYESYTSFSIGNSLNYTTTTTEITGYEEKLLPQTISNIYLSPTKKVIGGWIKDSSGAKLFYGGLAFGYTGNYTTSTITIRGTNYDLYTLTSSGTLTLGIDAQVWACGSGAGGGTATSYGSGGGGGGGYVLETTTLPKGEYAVTIGAGGGINSNGNATKIGNLTASGGSTMATIANGGSGGSGGGAGGKCTANAYMMGSGGTGAGISTYPFGLTDLKAHSAGGGGGADYISYYNNGNTYARIVSGGNGGTNGSNGVALNNHSFKGGNGGDYGGGAGGSTSSNAAKQATFYGGGGGGGSRNDSSYNTGRRGYQGVAYVLIQK